MQIRGSNRREGRGRFQARRAYHGGGNHDNHANRPTDQTYQKRDFDNRHRPNQNMEQKSPRAPATHAEDADQTVVSKLEAKVKKLEGMLDAKAQIDLASKETWSVLNATRKDTMHANAQAMTQKQKERFSWRSL